MQLLFNFLAVIYVFVCAFLILVVLLQAGRGGGLGGAFGAGGSQTVFGSAGASNFLTRLTWVCAVLFMTLSMALAYLSSTSDSLLDEQEAIANERNAARRVTATPAPTKAEPGALSDPAAAAAPAAPAAAPVEPTEPAASAEPAEPAAPQAPATE
jgi:preprotein translocase subunit SecG